MRRTLPSLLFAVLGFTALAAASFAAPVPRRAEAEVDLAEGFNALEAGDVAAAIDWLSKAEQLDPRRGHAAGVGPVAASRMREAAAEIEASLTGGRPLQAVDDRGLWEGTVGLSAAADTNPNLLSNDLSVPAPGPGDKVVQGGDSDGFGRATCGSGSIPSTPGRSPTSA